MNLQSLREYKRRRLDSEDDEQPTSCVVCLEPLSTKDTADIGCHRAFCVDCMVSWAEITNTCPLCKKRFHAIYHYTQDGVRRKVANVKDVDLFPDYSDEDEEEEDVIPCSVCGLADQEDQLLLCDGCDLPWHMKCLDPPLLSVPEGEWFCPPCVNDAIDAENMFEKRKKQRVLSDFWQDEDFAPPPRLHKRQLKLTRPMALGPAFGEFTSYIRANHQTPPRGWRPSVPPIQDDGISPDTVLCPDSLEDSK